MPLLFFVLIVAVGLQIGLCQDGYAADLPDIGDGAGRVLTPEDERRIGAQFYRQLQRSVKIIDDPEVNQYIESLGLMLVSNSDNPFQPFRFFVIDAPSINAFAAPGGYIGIHSGLISSARNEGELASVLAHEVAHITQRHLARAIEAQSKSAPLSTAALLAAILLGAQGSGQAAQAAVASTIAGAQQSSINFTRSNEKEADRTGIAILARSGIDPRAMPDFFERLEQVSRVNKSALPEFLRTHPVTQSRIADSRSRADQHSGAGRIDSDYFQLIKARLQVILSDNKQDVLQQFEAAVGKADATAATRYGYALALTINEKYEAARQQLEKLLQQAPDHSHYVSALAEVELADHNDERALQLLADNFELNPYNHAVTMNYADALLLTQHPQQAQELLQAHLRRGGGSSSALTYKLLAQAFGASNATLEAHEALAEYEYLSGDYDEAISHLEIASRLAKDKDQLAAQRIDARIEQLKNMISEDRRG